MNSERNLRMWLRRTWIMTCRNARMFAGRKMLIALIGPIIITPLVIYASNAERYGDIYEETRTTLFTIVAAAIYIGLFNSLGLICKERPVIKRELITGMNSSEYVMAHVLCQFAVCLIQSFIVVAFIVWGGSTKLLEGRSITCKPLVFQNSEFLELWISFMLIMFAADMLGLMISSIARSAEIANLVAPVVIVLELVFGNVLFELKGTLMKFIGSLMISEHGMYAVGSTVDLLSYKMAIQTGDNGSKVAQMFPELLAKGDCAENAYEHVASHVTTQWGVMLLFIVICIALCIIMLKRIKNQGR